MDHYDGPAFYRKFPVTPNSKAPVDPLSDRAAAQVERRQKQNARTQREAEAAHAAVKSLRTTTTPAQPKKTGNGTMSSGNYRPFQVTELPRQLHWLAQPGVTRQQHYQKLIQQLHKPLETFFRFARPGEVVTPSSAAATVVFTPQKAPASTAKSPATPASSSASQGQVAETPAVSDMSSAASSAVTPSDSSEASQVPSSAQPASQAVAEPAPTEIFYPEAASVASAPEQTTPSETASTSTATSQVASRPVDSGDYLPVGTPKSVPTTPAVAATTSQTSTATSADAKRVTSQTVDAPATAASPSTEDTDVNRLLDRATTPMTSGVASEKVTSQVAMSSHAASQVTPATTTSVESATAAQPQAQAAPQPKPKPKAKPSRGLGHSLGDIMQEEGNEQRNLALFTDTPTPQPQTDVETSDRGYHFPDLKLLPKPVVPDEQALDDWIQHQGEVLDATLAAFHVDAHVTDWTIGPTVTQFQISLALGVKVNKITNLNDDLKRALAAKDIRIEAPIPGKTTVGIEIPNLKSRPVMLSEILNAPAFKQSESPLTVALGVDLFGKPQVTDLRKMPHGLIAGATGSGKSVFINSLLVSILYKATPQQVKLLLIDPKAVEMAPYDGLPHLLSPVISDPKAAAAALKWVVTEMDQRYEKLAAAGVRNIEQFNDRADANDEPSLKMPYIVIVIDELADLMMMAASEVQDYIVRITQKARAAGIHLLVATQRPSVDIVTGTIKNNIPTRIAFMVSSQVDSRTILDTTGAESLLGRGDMLYLGNGASQPMRLQGAYVEAEVDRVTDFVRTQGTPHYAFEPNGLLKKETTEENQDELLPKVLDYIAKEKTVSTSKLQRVFSIGYNRAANLIDDLEQHHYVSPQHGSKPREVYLTPDDLGKQLPEPHDQSAPYSS